MYLLLDLADNDTIHLALVTVSKVVEWREMGRNRELLLLIHKFLHQEGCAPLDIRGIMVVVGTGSFTSTRIATTVANTWAYVHHIPLLAIQSAEVEHLQSLIPRLLLQDPGGFISPTYSAEPRLGPRSFV
jgi:tRNA A37 threonylcarbamoyladenosine modification protein TsaB